LKIVKSPYLNKNHPISMKFGVDTTRADLELGDSHLTKYDFFLNSRWRTAAILKIVFGHNSATHCPISMKFCAG